MGNAARAMEKPMVPAMRRLMGNAVRTPVPASSGGEGGMQLPTTEKRQRQWERTLQNGDGGPGLFGNSGSPTHAPPSPAVSISEALASPREEGQGEF